VVKRSVRRLGGHFWTVAPHLRHALRRPQLPDAVPWSTVVDDPRLGPVMAGGDLRHTPGADTLLVIIHGLGGTPHSGYVMAAARDAHSEGLATLCLALRGADHAGEDIYHSGLTDDLHQLVADPALDRYQHIAVLGFSVGGHVALHFAHEQSGVEGSNRACTYEPSGRVLAVATVCPPIALQPALDHIDRAQCSIYRRHVMRGLFRQYRAVAARRDMRFSLETVTAARTLREWDARTAVPRFGFESPEHYYEVQSVAPYLPRLTVPTLLVAAETDPMVPGHVIRDHLPKPGQGSLEVRWLPRGGHLGAPARADLGLGSRRGLVPQVVHWLLGQRSSLG